MKPIKYQERLGTIMIQNALQSLAYDRAKTQRTVTLIQREVLEDTYDDVIFSDEVKPVTEDVIPEVDPDDIDFQDIVKSDFDDDDMKDAALNDLAAMIDNTPDDEDAEIERILSSDGDIDEDDILLGDDDDDDIDIDIDELDDDL